MSARQKEKYKTGLPNPYVSKKISRRMANIVTIFMMLLVIYPLIFILTVSFKNNQEFYTNIWGFPSIWRFENYAKAWIDGNIKLFATNSIIVTLLAVTGSVFLSALAGYSLSKMHIPFAEIIIGILMGLNFVPGIAIYISLYIQMNTFGFGKTLWMLILPYLTWQIPFSLFIYKKFFDSISQEILEAARVDGSKELNTFLHIVLPLVKPATATVIVFNFINVWGEYLWVSIASSAAVKIRTIPVGLLNFRGEYGVEWGPFASAILIIIIPLICVFIYFQKYFIQGLTSGAVKG